MNTYGLRYASKSGDVVHICFVDYFDVPQQKVLMIVQFVFVFFYVSLEPNRLSEDWIKNLITCKVIG